MPIKNIFYAQSGGPTAVINTTAYGVIQQAKRYPDQIGKVIAGHNGILGALKEELIDTSTLSNSELEALPNRPGSAFGSCRYKLKPFTENQSEYQRLVEVFKAHQIGYFFYNGGGDSQDTAYKISQISEQLDYPITCIGLPKTIDNDLAFTDNCPGFGSVAKYIATSIQEASIDLMGMCSSSTKVFILEVMGRHAGWIAASAGLAQTSQDDPPQIILLPEVAFDRTAFLAKVVDTVNRHGYCSIVVSEGVKDKTGQFLSDAGQTDAFGHKQLGGVAPQISHMIQTECQLKCHWAVSDYLQRSARHLTSKTDFDQALAIGQAAVDFSLQGHNNIMLTIDRVNDTPYEWKVGSAPLSQVANAEKTLPTNFIQPDGWGITDACRAYLLPLIQGEAHPRFVNGLPDYPQYQWQHMTKKTATITL